MNLLPKLPFQQLCIAKQGGVVLFLALIALLVMSLAAVALIRSVDTSTIIAGNLAFKRAATTSADAGAEAAMTWLTNTQVANSAKSAITDTTHAFNITNAAQGYYSNADPALDLFADATWSAATGIASVTDTSGNTIRYIIQRMCRVANVAIQNADCLFSSATVDTNGQAVPLPQDICEGPGCPAAGQTPQIRITTRTTGPKNTVSYVQAFVY
jgi:type IV pilus assembly protein PilX